MDVGLHPRDRIIYTVSLLDDPIHRLATYFSTLLISIDKPSCSYHLNDIRPFGKFLKVSQSPLARMESRMICKHM